MKAWVKVSEKPVIASPAKGGTKQSQYILFIVTLALIIKLSLFAFAAIHAPQSKMMPDSMHYLELGEVLANKGIFALNDEQGILRYEMLRTPGYPAFLAIFHNLMRIPVSGVVLLQIAFTLSAALITYKTALEISQKIALLSMAIVLFDPPITIFSLMVLTEALFLLLISFFMLAFTLYLKNKKIFLLILSVLCLAAATYVRPVSYYLGLAVALFIIYANKAENFKKICTHVVIFLLVIYCLLGSWQIRNYVRCHNFAFTSVENENSGKGLFKSYIRNRDPYTKGMAPLPYYISVSSRCLMSLMTRPGNLKYFKSDILTAIGKALAYPWMVFWLVGFLLGIINMRRNLYIQFMLFIMLYFVAASVVSLMWDVGERLRVPMMPFIAIVSAYGWMNLINNSSPPRKQI